MASTTIELELYKTRDVAADSPLLFTFVFAGFGQIAAPLSVQYVLHSPLTRKPGMLNLNLRQSQSGGAQAHVNIWGVLAASHILFPQHRVVFHIFNAVWLSF